MDCFITFCMAHRTVYGSLVSTALLTKCKVSTNLATIGHNSATTAPPPRVSRTPYRLHAVSLRPLSGSLVSLVGQRCVQEIHFWLRKARWCFLFSGSFAITFKRMEGTQPGWLHCILHFVTDPTIRNTVV